MQHTEARACPDSQVWHQPQGNPIHHGTFRGPAARLAHLRAALAQRPTLNSGSLSPLLFPRVWVCVYVVAC